MNPALRRSAAHVFVDSLDAPVLDSDDLHHLTRVLRLRAGETVSVSDGRGGWRLCTLDGTALEPTAEPSFDVAAACPITIGFVVPKGDRPEWIVQKLTEIGVDGILVLHSARSVVRWEGERSQRQLDRLRRVAREAAMQSRRVWLPRIDGPTAIDALPPGDFGLAEPDGEPLTLSTPTILVGPEGGWTETELQSFAAHRRLGNTVLRVETAALVAASTLVGLRDAGAPT